MAFSSSKLSQICNQSLVYEVGQEDQLTPISARLSPLECASVCLWTDANEVLELVAEGG